MELFEVFYSVGEDERSDFVVALDEADARQHLDSLSIGGYRILMRDNETSLTHAAIAPFLPEVINRLDRQSDGSWQESVV